MRTHVLLADMAAQKKGLTEYFIQTLSNGSKPIVTMIDVNT